MLSSYSHEYIKQNPHIKYGMWKKTVTIDKKYIREYDAFVKELSRCKQLVFATEESKSLRVVSVAARDAEKNSADDFVCDCAARILTTYFKHAYLSERLNVGRITAAETALLSVMVYYDCETDYAELFDMLKSYDVISLDGVFNFAMKDIKEDWEELAAISENLFDGAYDDDDLYDVAGYVVDEKADRCRLLIADATDPVVTELPNGGFVTVDDFYGDVTLNLINCVVGKGAKEVTLDASFKDGRLTDAISRFAKVRRL